MNWKMLCLATILLWMVATPALRAQQPAEQEAEAAAEEQAAEAAPADSERKNDQTFVIGAGFGSHSFATPHRAFEDVLLEVHSTLLLQVYGEWYLLDQLGFGIRLMGFGESASSSTSLTFGGTTFTTSSEAELDVGNVLLTVNWIPYGAGEYLRFGVMGGLGRTDYEYTETLEPGPDTAITTSGPATLLGGYVDWGGEGFGARFGLQHLAADLDPSGGVPVRSIDGNEWYFDLRWAF